MHAALLPISAKIIIFTIFPSQSKTWESEKADAPKKDSLSFMVQKVRSKINEGLRPETLTRDFKPPLGRRDQKRTRIDTSAVRF
jgi:hypothetical protein